MKEIRKDIQGLRALAVMSVVLYHYDSHYLPSGFAGVDVFFVISGFLMTSIIFKGLLNHNFSALKFYLARAKRISPALCAVVLILLLFGYVFIEPLTYKEIGDHSLSSLLFYSNYTYLGESGYFDQSSKEKFLLHTWSLSVEWQFYIVYPIIMMLLKKTIHENYFRKSIVSLFVASLISSFYLTRHNPDYSYFMIVTRAWEMLLGGVVCLYPSVMNTKARRATEITGIMLVLASFIAFDESTPWPGISALVPTIGAALVIYSNVRRSILSNPIIQFIGMISYSMYLVHWVILVSLKKSYIHNSLLSYLIITFAIAIALFYLVERRRDFSYKSAIIYTIAIISSYLVSINGVSSRLNDVKEFQVDAATYRAENEGHAGVSNSKSVIYFNASEKNFDYILIGSSHARHYYEYIIKSGKKVASLALDGCDSTKNYYYSRLSPALCAARYKQTVEFINSHPGKKIIWASVWNKPENKRDADLVDSQISSEERWKHEISFFMEDIKGSNSDVYLIGDTPGAKKLMFECLAKNSLPIYALFNSAGCEEFEKKEPKPINSALISSARSNDRVHFIDSRNSLCDENKCNVIINKKPVYTDYGHLSKEGSKIVGEYIFSETR